MEALCSIAHVASEGEVEASLQRLSATKAKGRRALGILACCHRAIKLNPDVGVCRALLSQSEIRQCINNVKGKERLSLLHAAVLRPTPDGAEIVELLLAIPEVDLNLVSTPDGLTPLHLACLLSRSAIVELLIRDRRVDLSARTLDCRTALHCARDREVVRMLVSKVNAAGSVQARDSHGRTALHYAAENHHTTIVEELLESCSNLDQVVDDHGRMPVHLAAQNGHGEEVRLLLRHAPHTLHSQDEDSLTPLHHAARGGHLHILQDWISQSEDPMFVTLLGVTTHYEVAAFLLQELSAQQQVVASSLLRWAIESRAASLIPQILKWQPHLANEIVDQEKNQTALHVATISRQIQVVQALCVEQGWSLRTNRKDKYNKTALDYAHDLNYKDLCELLTERADVKEHITKLQKERDAYVAGANIIVVVAVLIAGASFVSCVKPLDQSSGLPKSAPTPPLHLMIQTTFLTSMAATTLGACASLPFSFGLYTGSFKPTSCYRSDYIGHKVRRVRVLVVLASYFLLSSVASMVFSFLCASEFGVDAAMRTLLACRAFTVTLASITLLLLAAYFGRAQYCKTKQLEWRRRTSLRASCFSTEESSVSIKL